MHLDIREALSHKIGPFPGYVWAGGATFGLLLYLHFHKGTAAPAADTSGGSDGVVSNPGLDTGGGGGGGGAAGDTGAGGDAGTFLDPTPTPTFFPDPQADSTVWPDPTNPYTPPPTAPTPAAPVFHGSVTPSGAIATGETIGGLPVVQTPGTAAAEAQNASAVIYSQISPTGGVGGTGEVIQSTNILQPKAGSPVLV